MKINRENIKLLGFKPHESFGKNVFQLIINNYTLQVWFLSEEITFTINNGITRHRITDIEEIFGFIADDCFKAGKLNKIDEIKKILDL